MHEPTGEEGLDQILARDPRFRREAYLFVREALDHTQKGILKATRGQVRHIHVTGQQLLQGIREFAIAQFGPMAITVLEDWGIHDCSDFGEIVFNMIDSGLLAKTERDSKDDFKGGYRFEDAFRKPFLPKAKLAPAQKPVA